jgi:hypothetical protein
MKITVAKKLNSLEEWRLVSGFLDSCKFNESSKEKGLSRIGRFLDFCKTNRFDLNLIADFMNLCELEGLRPKDALRAINAQDWDKWDLSHWGFE